VRNIASEVFVELAAHGAGAHRQGFNVVFVVHVDPKKIPERQAR
jgi:hypothetical protein